MQIFTKERTLTPSWSLVAPSYKLLRDNLWQVAYLSFLPTLLLTVGLMMFNDTTKLDFSTTRHQLGLAVSIIGGLWTLLAYPGFLYMQVHALRGKEMSPMESFKRGLPFLLPFIALSIVAGILIIGGFFLLIIPGLLLTRGFFLAAYYVVDGKLGPIAALKQSYRDSRPVTAWIWGIIGVELVFALISGTLGYLPVIGVIIGTTITYAYVFAPAIRYAEITKNFRVDK